MIMTKSMRITMITMKMVITKIIISEEGKKVR